MRSFGQFKDKVIYDGAKKTAISVRDGVLEYFGAEIGRTPVDKIFRVYRSPATIANAAALMSGIPLTNGHVSLDSAPTDPKGTVLTSKMIDIDLPEYKSRLGVVNTLGVADDVQSFLDAGIRELSLGYMADLVDAPAGSDFDLEQLNILPHHLAYLTAGRCGSVCSFIDHHKNEGNEPMTKPLHKAFTDAEGAPSMTDIVAIAQALPDALKTLPVDKLTEILPMLQEIVKSAGGNAAPEGEETIEGGADTMEGGDADTMEGGDADTLEGGQDTLAGGEDDKKIAVTDTAEFKDAVSKASKASVKQHVEVMDKARQFLAANYNFKGKSTTQIMKDALAVDHGAQQFADGELELAFKMLKKTTSRHQNFGDGVAAGRFAAVANKTL
jgi:hypothetical protein